MFFFALFLGYVQVFWERVPRVRPTPPIIVEGTPPTGRAIEREAANSQPFLQRSVLTALMTSNCLNYRKDLFQRTLPSPLNGLSRYSTNGEMLEISTIRTTQSRTTIVERPSPGRLSSNDPASLNTYLSKFAVEARKVTR